MSSKQPPHWIFSLYFSQGLPYAIIMLVSVFLLHSVGLNNQSTVIITSCLALPWAFKPIIAPLLEGYQSKRILVILCEFFLSFLCLIIAVCLFFSWLKLMVMMILLLALLATAHDIVSDGVYLNSLSLSIQHQYIGLRSCAYQSARLLANALGLFLVGYFLKQYTAITVWGIMFVFFSGILFAIGGYHYFKLPICTPSPTEKNNSSKEKIYLTIKRFLRLPQAKIFILFLLFYSATDAQLMKIVPLFLLDSAKRGGVDLSMESVSIYYGALGTIAMMIGALFGSSIIRKLSSNTPLLAATLLLLICHLGYIFLFSFHTIFEICSIIFAAQFAFGLCNTLYLSKLLQFVAYERYKMSLYALGTAVMAFSMSAFGLLAGFVIAKLSYHEFFMYILCFDFLVFIFLVFFNTQLMNRSYEFS